MLFTPAFHRTTLTDGTGTEVVVRAGKVVEILEGGSTMIPADGVVISATGAKRLWVREALPVGTTVSISTYLTPVNTGDNPWTRAEDIVGGGPKLFGLPAFGLIGFVGAGVGAMWLLRSIARSGRHD